jgi:16S rRNA C967 or C1407 C5-methylase (RsmB/RsmF family)
MRNTGAIIAMDNNLERIKTLKYTLEKIGCLNTVVLMQESEKFHSNRKFDRILVDAPCSSEALMFEERDAMANWSIPLIQRKAEMQKRMLSNAANLLGKKGTIVYSTCTTAPEENEAVVDYVLSQNPELRVEKLEFEKFKTRSGIAEWQGKEFNQQVKNCARICPQDNGSLAFFVAKIVKK